MPNDPNAEKILQTDNQQGGVNIVNSKMTVKGDIVGRDKNIFNIFTGKDTAQDRRNQLILLDKAKTFWIEGVLERSVYSVMRIDLGKVEETGAVDHPWDMVIESEGAEKIRLPHGQAIIETFDAMNHSLLILGAPGSGKTMTMLELANDLIKRAGESPNAPIPVVFNLSSWATRQQPLADWLVEELQTKYQIPRRISKQWIKDGVILPLLDGLDEVRAESREACAVAINKFKTDYGSLGGMVVCSRVEEYNSLKTHLKLQGAILIQPLTQDQVDDWLGAAGNKLASLRSVLMTDATLRELTQTPLMLTVMGLAYQNTQVEATTDTSAESRRQQIFGAYVDQMFKRVARTKSQLYSRQQTMTWLSWLAKKMQAHGQSVFLIEGLQPSWLGAKRSSWLYLFLSRCISALAIDIANVMLFSEPLTLLLSAMIFGIFWAMVDALLFLRGDFPFRNVIRILTLGFGGGLAFLMTLPMVFPWSNDDLGTGANWAMFFGTALFGFASNGLLYGLFFGLYSVEDRLDNDVRFLETLGWSWRRARLGGMIGCGSGLVIMFFLSLLAIPILFVVMASPDYTSDYFLLVVSAVTSLFILTSCYLAPAAGLTGISIGALFGGIVSKISRGQFTSSWILKLKNMGIVGLLIAIVSSISATPLTFLYHVVAKDDILSGVTDAIQFGLFVSILAMLWFGIFSVIRHFTLRFILTFSEHIPFNLSRFLDYAVERIFMQRVGSGYIFIHRALLEYFAEQ